MSSRFPAIVPYSARFREALGVLCTDTPALTMCRAWLESDDESLQEWVLNHARLEWAQGIGIIDAARVMANQPDEGRAELVSHEVELLLRAADAAPLPTSVRKQQRVPKTLPKGATIQSFWDAKSMNMLVIATDQKLHTTVYYDYSALREA